MTFASVEQVLGTPPGPEVAVRGWIYRARSGGAIVFAVLRDRSGIVRVTVKKGNVPDGDFEAARDVTVESSVEVKGTSTRTSAPPEGRSRAPRRSGRWARSRHFP